MSEKQNFLFPSVCPPTTSLNPGSPFTPRLILVLEKKKKREEKYGKRILCATHSLASKALGEISAFASGIGNFVVY